MPKKSLHKKREETGKKSNGKKIFTCRHLNEKWTTTVLE